VKNIRAVRQHTALQERGGAARVARLLHERLPGLGLASELSFETAEEPGAQATPAAEAGRGLAGDTLLHLHASLDWPALLAALPGDRPLALTLHDAGLLTGGCAYPLDCPGAAEGCPEPCPRGFARARERQTLQLGRLRRLGPALAAPSSWLAGLARAALPGLAVTVIPNGVPWPGRRPSRALARKALGIAPQARVVVFAAHGGAEAAYKSGPRWAEYWQGLKKRAPGALGFAVGGREARRDGDFVTWPYVDRQRMDLLFSAADLLFYPTLADNHPLVVLEAMSRGAACAAFAVGGLPEQIVDGVSGILVPPGQDQVLLDAAGALLASPARLREMGEQAFSRGAARFTAERMAGDYLRFLRA
jgi:glycosyltransferase involved in cell wall biosynthesis